MYQIVIMVSKLDPCSYPMVFTGADTGFRNGGGGVRVTVKY